MTIALFGPGGYSYSVQCVFQFNLYPKQLCTSRCVADSLTSARWYHYRHIRCFQSPCGIGPTGCDGIGPRVLRSCATSLCEPITFLFNTCITTSSYPKEWKKHKICPVPKKGDLSNHTNYRPISLLCTISKVLERIVYDKVISFVRPLISSQQFGFLKNRSCVTQLLSSFQIILDAVNQGKACDVVFLDLSKAFDTVPHNELLFKIWRLGITGSIWKWIASYLSIMRHFVSIDGHDSVELPVLSGVPQGSVLGPLLFLLYINDAPTSVTVAIPFHFADDSKLLHSVSNVSDCLMLQQDLESFEKWCAEWKLLLNCKKSSVVHFTSNRVESTHYPPYRVANSDLVTSENFCDLGILVSEDLSWSGHCAKVCSKAYKSLQLVRRSITSTSESLKRKLYLTLVRSHFAYCSQLWRPRLIRDIKKVENVQRRASRYLVGGHLSGYKERLVKLELLPIMYWLELQDIMFLVKNLKSPSDNFNILDYLQFIDGPSRSASRNLLRHKYSRTSEARHFYMTRITRLWNKLPGLDLSLAISTLRSKLYETLWCHFRTNFNQANTCTFHFLCPCPNCFLTNF